MADQKISSVDIFNTAFKPITEKMTFENTGMKDTKIVSETEGGIPQTQAQENVA